MQRFQQIEQTTATAMQALTSSDVIEMSQWSEITNGCASVVRVLPITYTSGNWTEVNNKMRELRMMIDNARYRVEPSRFGDFRTAPLIPPASPGRAEYDRQLRMAENRVQNTMQMVATAISNNGLSYDVNNPLAVLPQDQIRQDDQTTMSLDAATDVAINTLVSYRLFLHDAPRPPARFLLGNALYRHAAVAGTDYRAYIDDNSDYATSLQRLEAIENATDLAIAGAERIARVDAALEDVRAARAGAASGVDAASGVSPRPPVTPPMSHARQQLNNVAEFRRQFDVERAGRRWREGLVFSSEIAELESTRRESTATSYAALLAGPGEHHPMTPDEELAMHEGDMGSFGADLLGNRGVMLDRLELIPDLRLPSDCDTLAGIMRLDATPNVTDVEVKLVGLVSPEVTFRRWHILWHVTHNPRVVALNAAAEAVLGDDRIHEVENSRLSTAYGSDIGVSLPVEQAVP
jgi:hypothetical protein